MSQRWGPYFPCLIALAVICSFVGVNSQSQDPTYSICRDRNSLGHFLIQSVNALDCVKEGRPCHCFDDQRELYDRSIAHVLGCSNMPNLGSQEVRLLDNAVLQWYDSICANPQSDFNPHEIRQLVVSSSSSNAAAANVPTTNQKSVPQPIVVTKTTVVEVEKAPTTNKQNQNQVQSPIVAGASAIPAFQQSQQPQHPNAIHPNNGTYPDQTSSSAASLISQSAVLCIAASTLTLMVSMMAV